MIKGIEKLTRAQIELMQRVHQNHKIALGQEVNIIETWLNGDGVVCVKLSDGDWYHYTNNGQWY